MNPLSSLAQGLIRCHACGQLNNFTLSICPLCHSELHQRQPYSLQRTTALLISAYCLYIPANILPIMTVTKFNIGEPHTIMGGIISLIQSDMIPIALLVLIASILVPLIKLLGLTLLVLAVHYRWQVNTRRWTSVYRLIVFIGRWSMLDIFMISILVSLVNLGVMAQVLAGVAATAFSSVVVLTMFAAKTFDIRLLWDVQDD
jgi:paraquat-inducible protein A